MPDFPIISGKRLLAILQKHGFEFVRQKGSHARVASADGKCKTVIPIHANRDLPIGTLKNILEDLDIKGNEFIEWF